VGKKSSECREPAHVTFRISQDSLRLLLPKAIISAIEALLDAENCLIPSPKRVELRNAICALRRAYHIPNEVDARELHALLEESDDGV